MHVELEINDTGYSCDADAGETLLRVLRRLGFWSVKYGCDTGECGACAVLVDGRPILSCLYPVPKAVGSRITTIEALGHPNTLHPLQQCFLDRGAVQCGYCTPAMLLVAHALIRSRTQPDPGEIREALASVLCRCTGYVKPIEAIAAGADAASGIAATSPEPRVPRAVDRAPRSVTPGGG